MTTAATIATDRLILRAPTAADWPAYRAFMQTPAAAFFKGHNSETEAWKSFGTLIWHWAHLGFGPFAVTAQDDPTCIGIVGPKCPPGWPEGEVTWIAFASAQGKGIASEAARAALQHAYTTLGWETAVSYIEPENTRSEALARRLGATVDPHAPLPGGPVRAWRHLSPAELAA